MTNKIKDNITRQDKDSKNIKNDKKEYKTPVIIEYGKLKDITLGGSPGSGDSGAPGIQQPP